METRIRLARPIPMQQLAVRVQACPRHKMHLHLEQVHSRLRVSHIMFCEGTWNIFAVCLLSALLSRETRSSSLVLVESFEKTMEDPKCTKDGLIRKMVLEKVMTEKQLTGHRAG